jgi:ApbE superfamily uncharacterized protein (UPF0280 family)
VTVLARDAATADAAATMVANAVNVEHPHVSRAPAVSLDPDSDLGARLVTVGVGTLPAYLVGDALAAGASLADELRHRGLIVAAALLAKGQMRSVGISTPALAEGELA